MRYCLVFIFLLAAAGAASAWDVATLKVDGKLYRLEGIDAPEMDQTCLDPFGELYHCGRKALQERETFIAGRPVRCVDLGVDPTFSDRRIGRCTVEGTDLHRWLVQEGWALSAGKGANGPYKEEEEGAREGRFGLWGGCFVAPENFRRWRKRRADLLGPSCPPDARERLFPEEPPAPAGCAIKGKYVMRAWPYRGIYHPPGCGSHARTKKAERWFCSEEEARAAQFRRSLTCGWW